MTTGTYTGANRNEIIMLYHGQTTIRNVFFGFIIGVIFNQIIEAGFSIVYVYE